MDRRSFFKRAGGVVGAALFIPAERLVFGVPTAIAAPEPAVLVPPPVTPLTLPTGADWVSKIWAEMIEESTSFGSVVNRDYERQIASYGDPLITPPASMRSASPREVWDKVRAEQQIIINKHAFVAYQIDRDPDWLTEGRAAMESRGYDFEQQRRLYWASRGLG